MSLPRLSFLYPFFLKPLRAADLKASLPPLSRAQPRARSRRLHSRACLCQEVYAQRYGSATESTPPPLPGRPEGTQAQSSSTATTSPSKSQETRPNTRVSQQATTRITAEKPTENSVESEAQNQSNIIKTETTKAEESPARDSAARRPQETINEPLENTKALETVLHLEAPTSKKSEESHHPHLHAPPYVHHFDTYSLVKDLEKGNFTEEQAITLMKAIRGLLAVNLGIAKEGLVSKSDVENEMYLFRAACSELRTEIQNTRKSSSEKMRTERAHLQHEVDILNQKLTQDSATLKDDLKGMFNDRKMVVRMEQRAMESAIQELNYKITVALNSDSRGYVEGLRWTLTRRAAMAIATMAVLILGSLRYSSYMIHLQQEERKKMAASTSTSTGNGPGSYTTPSRSTGTQTGESDGLVASIDAGSNQSYVSLG